MFFVFYVLFEHSFTFELFGLMTAKLKWILTYLLSWRRDDRAMSRMPLCISV